MRELEKRLGAAVVLAGERAVGLSRLGGSRWLLCFGIDANAFRG